MSVFICDKARLPFSIYFLLDFTAHIRSIFKIFTSMNIRNGSFFSRSINSQFVFYQVQITRLSKKNSCSFIKQYLM